MSNQKKSNDSSIGEFIVPIVDILTIILMKGTEFFFTGLYFLFEKYVLKRNKVELVKKIERDDLNNKRSTLMDEAIGYSVSKKRNILGKEINRTDHTVIVGASGSGKTVLLDNLMYEDMKQGKPVVYIDPKGDNESLINFINLCKWTGREFYIFSEYWNGEGACSLNPVKEGSSSNIADRIFKSFEWSEEHYAQICRNAIEAAIDFLIQNDEEVTIESIHTKLLFISDPNRKDEIEFSRKDIYGILLRLKKIINSDFGPKLKGANALSFSKIRKEKKCVYIGLSVLGYADIARSLGKIILGDVTYSAYDIYKVITPVNKEKLTKMSVVIDELSAVITHEFIEILNKSRGAKIEMTVAFQSPSDISKICPDLCVQVLENTSNWFVLKQRTKISAEMISDSIGTAEAKKLTLRVQDGEEQAQGSQRVVETLIVHSNIIKNLNVGQCILLQHNPTKVDLINLKYIDPKILYENVKLIKKEVLKSNLESKESKLNTTKNDWERSNLI